MIFSLWNERRYSCRTALKNKWKKLLTNWQLLGAPISEEDQVVTLLGSLPSSYSPLVTTLECSDGVKLSYVQLAILHEERKKKESLSDNQLSSALVGTQKKSKKTVRCYGCGELGHIRRFCRLSKSKVSQNYGHKVLDSECWWTAEWNVYTLKEQLYQLNCQPLQSEYAAITCSSGQHEVDIWHQRFGHIDEQQLHDIKRNELVIGAKIPNKNLCNFVA